MKKKITLLALMLVLVATLAVLFVFNVSADDAITVTYNWYDGSTWETAMPNDDGSYTLRTSKKSGNGTVTLADGSKVDKEFYGWFDDEGNLYEPGQTVTFTKSTRIYEAYGVTVNNADDLYAVLNPWQNSTYVRLGADITTDKDLGSEWNTTVVNLNGHNLTSTRDDNAFYVKRGAFIMHGEGTFTHAPATTNKDDRAFVRFDSHGYGDTGNPQLFWIGKGTKVVTPYHLLYVTGSAAAKMPDIVIAGDITAKSVARINSIPKNARCYITSDASVNVSNSFLDLRNQTGSDVYMSLMLNGAIKLENKDALLLSDFIMTNKFEILTITSGSFTVSSVDAERIAMLLPDTLMLKATENDDGTTTYNVVEADCVHEWTFDAEASVEAQFGVTGVDVFECTKCGTSKKTITVYSPKNAEITVVVRTEEGDREYKVLAGDVFDLQFNGVGATAQCYIAGLKDTKDFTASQIVAIDIPSGIGQLSGFANEAIETVNILDNVSIVVESLVQMNSLKTINIGAANVTFRSISTSTVIETVSSNSAGASVSFASSCFDNVKTLKNLNLSTGSSYKFEGNSFRNTMLQKIILPDDSSVSFAGGAAFYGCPELTYVYFGRNCISDKKIWNKPFDCCYSLETVVLMDIIYIDQYVFCCNGNATSGASHCEGKGLNKGALNVYSHSEAMSLNANAFANRGVLGVNFYTLSTGLKSLSNCKYTIYAGLPHIYTLETITESTCVTQGTAGYVTSCPCGVDYRENAFTTYSTLDTSLNEAAHEAYGTEITYLPLSEEHTLSDVIKSVEFKNGYLSLGTKTFKCLYCDEASGTEEEASFPAIFAFNGYSAPEDGGYAITVGYSVDLDGLRAYEAIMGELEFGVVGAIYEKLNGKAPLDAVDVPVVKANISEEYASFDFVIKGFNDTQLDLALVMCAYVYDGAKYVYLQEAQVETPTAVSINSILANK